MTTTKAITNKPAETKQAVPDTKSASSVLDVKSVPIAGAPKTPEAAKQPDAKTADRPWLPNPWRVCQRRLRRPESGA